MLRLRDVVNRIYRRGAVGGVQQRGHQAGTGRLRDAAVGDAKVARLLMQVSG